jgi:hypothetical protein
MSEVLERRPPAGWFEVHAENYMNSGAASEALDEVRQHYPLSIHGVGLSLGSAAGIDNAHLKRLRTVIDRFQPALVSEHVAWSSDGQAYLNDLLPIPYTPESLSIVCDNIAATQDYLGRQILIENLSGYVCFTHSSISEEEFLVEVCRKTGCRLLLDINNVYVSSCNLGFDPKAYLANIPDHLIGEIHLAGHAVNETASGTIVIDSHNARISPKVWELYGGVVQRVGRRPTLIEWDSELPDFVVLLGQAMWADLISSAVDFGLHMQIGSASPGRLTPANDAPVMMEANAFAVDEREMEMAHA